MHRRVRREPAMGLAQDDLRWVLPRLHAVGRPGAPFSETSMRWIDPLVRCADLRIPLARCICQAGRWSLPTVDSLLPNTWTRRHDTPHRYRTSTERTPEIVHPKVFRQPSLGTQPPEDPSQSCIRTTRLRAREQVFAFAPGL